MYPRTALRAALMAIASIAVACTSEPATEVVLVVDADAWAEENIVEVELAVGSGEPSAHAQCGRACWRLLRSGLDRRSPSR